MNLSASGRWRNYLELVKFEHTLFALPFAYVGMLLAERGWPGWSVFFWITVAMVGARTASMALNRVIDAEIDARNPRTQNREIPRGAVSKRNAVALALAGFFCLTLAALELNVLTAALLPVAVFFLTFYPYTKRFTYLCHLWLGLTIGAAAAGGWIAVTGSFTLATWCLWLAVAAWIAGFDIIYALLDYDFDKAHGVQSIPVAFGRRRALLISRGLHVFTFVLLACVMGLTGSSLPYFVGLLAIGLILYRAQRLAQAPDLPSALRAFNGNLYVSSVMLVSVILDIMMTSS